MDVAGLVIGAVALASLFSTCLECFDMIEAGQNISRDLDIAMVKLDSLRVIFLIWGNVVGLHGVENTFNKEILGPDVQRTIYRLLSNLKVLFQDAERFRDRYGVEQIRGVDAPESSTSAGSLTTRNVGNLNSSHAHLGRMRNRTSWRAKVKWAIRDKKKFTVLLDDMKELIQQLRDITQAAADLQSQRRAFMAEVSIISDIETLEVLEEASVEEDPELSEVASQRILQLTEGSVASSGRTQSLFTESIYYSARTDAYTHSNTRDLRSEPSTVYDPREGITRNEFVETTELRLLETEHHGNDESDFAFSQRNNLKLIQEEDKLAFYMESFGGSRYQDILSPHREFLELKKLATGYGDRIISGDNRKMLFALLRDLAQNPPPLISFRAECPTLQIRRAALQGPSGSAYEGGVFFLGVIPAPEFPWRPPKCYFLTPIFHPNVASDGEILLDCLSDQWTPSPGLATLLMGIVSILGDPDWNTSCRLDVSYIYNKDPVGLNAMSRLLTQRYAGQSKPPQKLFKQYENDIMEFFVTQQVFPEISKAAKGWIQNSSFLRTI